MKKNIYLSAFACAALAATLVSCSKNDEPDNKKDLTTTTIGFQNVSADLIGGPSSYGENLYYGAEYQITKGYIAPLANGKYAQFSINYGQTFDASFNSVWGYSFYEGGIALSNHHDMTEASYTNQLSVYNSSSPSGGNFAVAFGSSNSAKENPMLNKYSDYSGCGHVYITDANGYGVSNPGAENSRVSGEGEDAWFDSVYINNTTYTFLTMRDGGPYASALNSENKGWFKVQFIAFDDDDPNETPLGYTEAYLANFDPAQADGYIGIIDTWTKVDLSSLPECEILVINFIGSDSGEYGLNTPGYCALDKFEISVEK